MIRLAIATIIVLALFTSALGGENKVTLAYRELYAPGHFGNWYEIMAPREAEEMLREAKHWGFNAYGDWLDTADLKHPANNPRREYLMSQAIWENKKRILSIAHRLGLQTNIVITPNHVFLDQLRPDLLADTSHDKRMFGQLICPSKPEARKIILDNYRWMFRDLKESGTQLDSITGGPYDYGGCSCDECRPWITTFGQLMVEIHDVAREWFPNVKLRLLGWWWNRQEHDTFREWADANYPERFASLSAHIPYGHTQPDPSIVLPKSCEFHAFVHIGYGDKSTPRDAYGAWGPMAAPERIPTTIADITKGGATGFAAYSEGHYDDVNKALLAGIASGRHPDATSVLKSYASHYFGANAGQQDAWAAWLKQWGEPFAVDAVSTRKGFDKLDQTARGTWRFDQWESRLRLFEANQEVLEGKEWDAARLSAARRFYDERERMYRDIWKLGLVRHVLNPRYHQPSWYAEYAKQPQETMVSDEQ